MKWWELVPKLHICNQNEQKQASTPQDYKSLAAAARFRIWESAPNCFQPSRKNPTESSPSIITPGRNYKKHSYINGILTLYFHTLALGSLHYVFRRSLSNEKPTNFIHNNLHWILLDLLHSVQQKLFNKFVLIRAFLCFQRQSLLQSLYLLTTKVHFALKRLLQKNDFVFQIVLSTFLSHWSYLPISLCLR